MAKTTTTSAKNAPLPVSEKPAAGPVKHKTVVQKPCAARLPRIKAARMKPDSTRTQKAPLMAFLRAVRHATAPGTNSASANAQYMLSAMYDAELCELLEDSLKFMTHSDRKLTLHTKDVDCAAEQRYVFTV